MNMKRCDNSSVGVLITDPDGRLLVFESATWPERIAPVASHVFDAHRDYRDAAIAEVEEEIGLTVTSLEYVAGGWRPNACRRTPGPGGTGHHWQIFRAETEGELDPSPRETRRVFWASGEELKELAERTCWYAYDGLTAEEFAARPGLEPVWCRWLVETGFIYLTPADLQQIEQLLQDTHAGHAPGTR